MKTFNLVAISAAGISAMAVVAAHGQTDATTSSYGPNSSAAVDASDNLHVPGDYRANLQFLGSWAVADNHGQGSKELHVVYASPGTIASYRKNSDFPTARRSLFQAATQQMTTGTVSHEDTMKGWFVMVKDSEGRHAGNKLWGDGWGWSWFDADNPSKTNARQLTRTS